MKYETPELNALPAINAIQSSESRKGEPCPVDQLRPQFDNETTAGYADWE